MRRSSSGRVRRKASPCARHVLPLPEQHLRRLAFARNQRAHHTASGLRGYLLPHPLRIVMREGSIWHALRRNMGRAWGSQVIAR